MNCSSRSAALLLISVLYAASARAQETFRIAGTIIDAATRKPIAFARVMLDVPETRTAPKPVQFVKTAADGKFAFTVNRPGMYMVSAIRRGVTQYYGSPSALNAGMGVGVLVGAGQITDHLVFRWFTSAAISGRVVDSNGDPLPNAMVQLVGAGVWNGGRRMRPFGAQRTDENGRYRFGGIAPISYFLVVTADHTSTNGGDPGREQDESPSTAYLPVYHPTMPGLGENANPIILQAGEEPSVDVSLASIPGVNVKVTYGNRDSASAENGSQDSFLCEIIAEPFSGLDVHQTSTWAAGGSAYFRGVPPGDYVVRARKGTQVIGEKRTRISGSEATVDLTPPPPTQVSGIVLFEGGRASARSFAIQFREASSRRAYNAPVTVDAQGQGKFAVAEFIPGNYYLYTISAEGFYIKDTKAGGASIRKSGAVRVTEGASSQFTLTVSNARGSVKGFVISGPEGGTPVPGVQVLLMEVEKEGGRNPTALVFQSDSDGSFEFDRAPAGDYWLIAVDDFDLEYHNPDVMERYRPHGMAVTIAPGDKKSGLKIPLVPRKQ